MQVRPHIPCCPDETLTDGLDLPLCPFQALVADEGRKPIEEQRERERERECLREMELRGVAWGFSVALALVCGVRWPPAHSSALAPENEVPLRPTVGLEEGRVTTVALPKGRTRR